MLAENKLVTLQQLIESATNEELIWMNGYLNGIVGKNFENSAPAVPKISTKVTIAYGTETGNSKKLALDFAARARKQGVIAKVQALDQYKLNDLQKEEIFLTILSTHGDGEPPIAAKKFYDHVHQNGFKLSKLKFAVLALGDSSYPLFCKAGEDVDAQLKNLGADCLLPIQKCDVDYEEEAMAWFDEIVKSVTGGKSLALTGKAAPIKKKATGKKYYEGRIITHLNLNDYGSLKETYHIEIEAEEIEYQPGDSIGIVSENHSDMINAILEITSAADASYIDYRGEMFSVRELLTQKLNIVYMPDRVVKQYAQIAGHEILPDRQDLLDLLTDYPINSVDRFTEMVKVLEPITPRLYSISSSLEATPGEVHITVAKNSFYLKGEQRLGLASGYLSLFKTGESIKFYVHPNHQFRLPADDKDVIMIGPGTGIAPFRAFLAERESTGATGRNWLFFGEQHFTSDFLYQTEIQSWSETGVLSKVATAFSRDQAFKVYVQDKMWEHRKELSVWIANGAYIYLCGSRDPMSYDVEKMFIKILEEFGEGSSEAEKVLAEMKERGRFITDVY